MLTNQTTTKAAAQAVNRHLASDREPSSAAAFVSVKGELVMDKDDLTPFPWAHVNSRKRTVANRPETEAERQVRLDAEQIAADAPIVVVLLGLDVKP